MPYVAPTPTTENENRIPRKPASSYKERTSAQNETTHQRLRP